MSSALQIPKQDTFHNRIGEGLPVTRPQSRGDRSRILRRVAGKKAREGAPFGVCATDVFSRRRVLGCHGEWLDVAELS